jgi:hypothetical protein
VDTVEEAAAVDTDVVQDPAEEAAAIARPPGAEALRRLQATPAAVDDAAAAVTRIAIAIATTAIAEAVDAAASVAVRTTAATTGSR